MKTLTKHPFDVGEAHSYGALTLVPLFPHEQRVDYVGLDEALARGLSVREVDQAGSVESLLVLNPLPELVLLYEGEELVGAKQNRIVRLTALIGAKSETHIPVTCVERGRWSYRTERFAPAPRAAYPELRRLQHGDRVQERSWASVSAKASRLDVLSPTDAAEKIYTDHARTLDEYLAALPRLDGQSGAIVGIGGVIALLDYVGRSDVFAGLYAKLLRGYALEAIETPVERPLRESAVKRFLSSIDPSHVQLAGSVGVGSAARYQGAVFGTELSAHGEVVAMTVYPRA